MKPQDFDRLSAYIDDQLSPAEKAALEQRLGREAELRAALTELRRTVKAVRSLPQVKPPRSFTLTAAQVGAPAGARPRRGSLFGTLRLAATMSALALVLVVGGDFAASRGFLGAAASPAEEVVFLTTETSTDAAAPEAATPEAEMGIMSAEAAPTDTLSPDVAPSGGSEAVPTGTLAPGVPPVGSAGSDAAPSPEGTPDMVAALVPATPTITSDRMADATQVAEAVPDVDETGNAGETGLADGTPSTKTVPPEATELNYAVEAREAAPGQAPGLSPLRLIEAALAMLTVLLGLGSWLASRNT